MKAEDKQPMFPVSKAELTQEQIRLHMLGLTSDSESVTFERQLASKPAIANAAQDVPPDDFVRKVKQSYEALHPRPE